MRFLVTGASGLIGKEVVSAAIERGHEVYSGWHQSQPLEGTPLHLDITDRVSIKKAFEVAPDAVIHLAALTDVDKCESDKALAFEQNSTPLVGISMEASNRDAHLVYVSTDYVFDGEKGLYTETDTPNPLSEYGLSKLRGEEAVQKGAKSWCIARTSTPFGIHPTRRSFGVMLVQKLSAGESFTVVSDQFTTPTYTVDLAAMLIEVAERRMDGILHTSGPDRLSRLEFARLLTQTFDLDESLLKPAEMSDIPWKAKRPRDSSLDTGMAVKVLKSRHAPMRQALRRFATQLANVQQGPHGDHTQLNKEKVS